MARWRQSLSKIDFDVVHHTGIKHQGAEFFSRLTATGEDQAPIEDDSPVAVLGTATKNNLKVCLVTDMATLLDEADLRATVQIVEDKDAEKEEAGLTTQEYL